MHRRIWPAAAVLLLLLLTPSAASAVVRHASPTGDGATSGCTAAEPPCTLRRAVETVSTPGDEVIVAPGFYSVGPAVAVNKAIDVHGAVGQARPRVQNVGGTVFEVSASGARLAGLQLEGSGSVVTGSTGTVLERLIVLSGPAASGTAVALGGRGLLRDSFVHTAATNGVAVGGLGTPQVTRLVNVTAFATDANGVAVFTDSNVGGICVPPFSSEMHATNVIARGGLYDLSVPGLCSGPQMLAIGHSNYRRAKVNQTATGRVEEAGGNQEADPLFADPASLDFHQLAGSSTIDAGTTSPFLGAADVDGEPRTLGATPDIGGDEYVPPAPPPPPGPAVDARAPVASLLSVAPTAFRPARRGGSVAQRRRRTGTRISYALDERATLTFRVRRAVRRRGRTRYVTLRGSFVHTGNPGGNRLRFSGRLRRRALRPGRYRLVGTPADAAGNRGAAVRASFRITR